MLLWRDVEPEAPVRDAAGVSTVKWTTILCYAVP